MQTIVASHNLTTGLFIFAFLAISLLTVRIIHALYFSSLAHVPGPAINKVTELPLRYLNARLERNERIFEWHRKYGPVVAIAPGQVSFSSVHIAKEIYSAAAKHPKSSYFDSLAMFGYRSVFMAKEPSDHRRLRKRIFAYYQPTKVYKPAVLGYIREYARRACVEMGKAIPAKQAGDFATVNIFVHCNNFSFDNITRFCLGPSLCSDTIRGGEEARSIYVGWEECELWAPLGSSFPMVLSLVKLFKKQLQGNELFLTGDSRLQAWCTQQLSIAAKDPTKAGQESESLLRQMLEYKSEDGSRLPLDEIAEEILDNFFAAQSVVTNALIFLLWDLARFPAWQQKIRKQLESFPTEQDGLPSWADIETASILDACLQESSRVHPLASGRAERVVPVTKSYGQTVIPKGTIVSASTKSLHYNATAFPQPEVFDPARWLDASETQLAAMKSSFMPYGQGARTCIGVPFAMAQMKHLVAFFILSHEILEDKASATNKASMMQLGTQSALPRGLRCDLKVRKISN
ncbi:cytochrome P450 family protein [Dothidotthia symphoricarpi CBS 119687]|uniref:Cytochrome P450 family protein n=1 Tax=Dothidotthia symphoricarpi CBS 119687 TaxID=1392245 RepID=A0A6A5ZYG5_9PLEO|nr:cytochrome P450 family protein [Dothidotthia symphoricarpi CBS 119687]KAF2123418.1 cytochrome P450 family protein [Dothidotthia symphoricarpi CBS 119687]